MEVETIKFKANGSLLFKLKRGVRSLLCGVLGHGWLHKGEIALVDEKGRDFRFCLHCGRCEKRERHEGWKG